MMRAKKYARNDILYYDLSLYNDKTQPVSMNVQDNRTIALIEKPSEYHLSIVRFTIPTSYVPIFIWPDAGSFTPDNTFYKVTINNSTVALTYVAQNALSAGQQNYLWVYSYQQMIDAINVALNAAFIAAAPAGVTTPPYMTYEPTTGLCSLIAETGYTSHHIYFNSNLYALFDNFNSKVFGYNLINAKDVEIFIKDNGNNYIVGYPPGYPVPGSANSYIMTQEYCSLFLWNSVRSIVITSNTLPVVGEALNVRNSSDLTSQNVSRKILTDFEFALENGVSNNTLRSYIQYQPTAEYRLIDMIGDSAQFTFDIQIYFQTKQLDLFQMYMPPGESFSMKVMFRKKDWQYI